MSQPRCIWEGTIRIRVHAGPAVLKPRDLLESDGLVICGSQGYWTVTSLEHLPFGEGFSSAEELKDTVLCFLWGGTRTLPQCHTLFLRASLLSLHPSSPQLTTVWTCPWELRERDTERLLCPGSPQGPACSVSLLLLLGNFLFAVFPYFACFLFKTYFTQKPQHHIFLFLYSVHLTCHCLLFLSYPRGATHCIPEGWNMVNARHSTNRGWLSKMREC